MGGRGLGLGCRRPEGGSRVPDGVVVGEQPWCVHVCAGRRRRRPPKKQQNKTHTHGNVVVVDADCVAIGNASPSDDRNCNKPPSTENGQQCCGAKVNHRSPGQTQTQTHTHTTGRPRAAWPSTRWILAGCARRAAAIAPNRAGDVAP